MSEAYEPKSSGKCPHCRHVVFFASPEGVWYDYPGGGRSSHPVYLRTGNDEENVYVYSSQCPNCKKPIVTAAIKEGQRLSRRLVHPYNVVRTVAQEVPKAIREDFLEASAVLSISEKASAALSRRCLQSLLTDVGYKQKDLNDQIEKAIKDLPRRLAENLDTIRTTGNFAAHPMKYKSTGAIVDVEPQEAEWNLDVLEALFEYFYVQPKQAEEKRKRLEAKLKEAGKPPLKKP